ncbi:hypothetical protein D7V93_00580 [Corallococcus llansteffanensis]|uniref:Uncharacterized protein n=2 Tax=Corallococcus llansteffanensis TaxID=2316731 RepID=A0A3A8QK04_9BACT|nr:hypothetical protein D7V93_00580 [Corallococcus llansteffanensis]
MPHPRLITNPRLLHRAVTCVGKNNESGAILHRDAGETQAADAWTTARRSADLVAYGVPFLANPDLPERIRIGRREGLLRVRAGAEEGRIGPRSAPGAPLRLEVVGLAEIGAQQPERLVAGIENAQPEHPRVGRMRQEHVQGREVHVQVGLREQLLEAVLPHAQVQPEHVVAVQLRAVVQLGVPGDDGREGGLPLVPREEEEVRCGDIQVHVLERVPDVLRQGFQADGSRDDVLPRSRTGGIYHARKQLGYDRTPTFPELPAMQFLNRIEAAWICVYAGGGSKLAQWLRQSTRMRWFNRAAGSAFVGAGILLVGFQR